MDRKQTYDSFPCQPLTQQIDIEASANIDRMLPSGVKDNCLLLVLAFSRKDVATMVSGLASSVAIILFCMYGDVECSM